MGAINYGTSKYICTLGYYDDDYYPSDQEIANTLLVNDDMSEEEAISALLEEHGYSLKSDYDQINSYIDDADFQYYDVALIPGYYDGFYMRIDRIFSDDDILESKEYILKEIKRLQKIGDISIDGHLMRVCYPGWCTGWEDTINDSLKVFNNAIDQEYRFIEDSYDKLNAD